MLIRRLHVNSEDCTNQGAPLGTAVLSAKCRVGVTFLMLKRKKAVKTGGGGFCNEIFSTKTGLSQDRNFTIKIAIVRAVLTLSK